MINGSTKASAPVVVMGDEVVATNDPKELNAHKELLSKAHGKVLISGLGLGNSLHELLKKDSIELVRVLEKEQDVRAINDAGIDKRALIKPINNLRT